MVIRSPHPDIAIPEQNILTYIFGSGQSLPEDPIWIDAADATRYLSLCTALQWIKRLAVGLDKLGLKKDEVVMIVSPNHIFLPVAYLGVIGSGRVLSAANPAYTADGRYVDEHDLLLELQADSVSDY
jgi:4-coumarate--CoA ligase